MSAFAFPQPGERQNASAIPVPEALLSNLLYLAVVATRDGWCNDSACPDCHNNRVSCAEAFRLLDPARRDRLDHWLYQTERIQPGEWRE